MGAPSAFPRCPALISPVPTRRIWFGFHTPHGAAEVTRHPPTPLPLPGETPGLSAVPPGHNIIPSSHPDEYIYDYFYIRWAPGVVQNMRKNSNTANLSNTSKCKKVIHLRVLPFPPLLFCERGAGRPRPHAWAPARPLPAIPSFFIFPPVFDKFASFFLHFSLTVASSQGQIEYAMYATMDASIPEWAMK